MNVHTLNTLKDTILSRPLLTSSSINCGYISIISVSRDPNSSITIDLMDGIQHYFGATF